MNRFFFSCFSYNMDGITILAVIIFFMFGCGCFFVTSPFFKEKFNPNNKKMAPLNPKDDERLPNANEIVHRDPVEDIFDIEHDFYIARDKRGWWTDVINCQNTGNTSIYCKPKSLWIWPY